MTHHSVSTVTNTHTYTHQCIISFHHSRIMRSLIVVFIAIYSQSNYVHSFSTLIYSNLYIHKKHQVQLYSQEFLKTDYLDSFDEDINGFGADYYKTTRLNGRDSINSLDIAGTYGEVLDTSIRFILNQNLINLDSSDVFYDLGSGTGKVVAQFSYETNCFKSIGIELGERRYNQSRQYLSQLLSTNHPSSKKIELLKGNILDINWQHDVTCLYICCICFPKELFSEIEDSIHNKCPNLKYILLIGKQLDDDRFNTRYDHRTVLCPTTWSDNEVLELYTKKI